MPHRARTEALDFPPDEVLTDLTSELEAEQPLAARGIMDTSPTPCRSAPSGDCFEVVLETMEKTSFVLSQRRSNGAMYITVCGRRAEAHGKGVKDMRSKQPWPRTRRTDRLRPISLHRWITRVVHGPPPTSDAEASHACGNDCCIAGAHLRWLPKADNLAERVGRSAYLPPSPRTGAPGRRYSSRLSGHE